jgi:hypothetical protein
MTPELTTVIGQLNIVGSNWRTDAPNQVAVREPKSVGSPGAGKGDLFVLTEVRGAKTDYKPLEQKLAGIVRDTYYLDRGSVTASLRRALQAAGDQLYQRNIQVSVDERVVAGVVALVMSGEDAFVAQIGPAALFAVLGDHIQRYPARSVWLDEALPPRPVKGRHSVEDINESALGISALIEPNLCHLRVSPQDMLVLADSGLAGQLPLSDVVKAVAGRNIKTTIKNLGQVAQASNCSALALMVVEETPATLGAFLKKNVSQPQRKPARTSIEAVAEAIAEAQPGAEFGAPVTSKSVSQPRVQWLGMFVKKPAPLEEAETLSNDPFDEEEAPPPKFRQPERSAPPRQETYPSGKKMSREAKVMASVARGSNFEPELRQTQPEERSIVHWLGLGFLLPIALLGRGLSALFHRNEEETESRKPRQAGAQAYRPQPAASVSWKWLLYTAIGIPLLVGLVVTVIYWQQGRQREAEYTEFITGAQNKFQQAQAADPATALGLMTEAEALLVEAEKIKASQPEITELRQKMAEQTDKVSDVQRMYYLPQLRQYTDEGTNLKSILVQGVELYVLDAGTDRIFHHRLDDLGEALLPDDQSLLVVSRGQAVENISVGDLLAMAWMPAGGNRQTSDLIVLNSTGLLEYNSSWGITSSALAAPSTPFGLPAAVDSFFGNFYILDPPANKLWRYLPTADGYSATPESYFPADPPVDLTNAVDLAIDGAVYILYKDGRVSKFEGGQPAAFNLTGLDMPLNNPVSIFTAPNESVQHIYIADTGNHRVVQLNKDGSFVHQFRPRDGETISFANLQDIFVDEIGGRLYVLDSNGLYVGNIPDE